VHADAQDRRHRQLHTTSKGARLARDLAHLQTRRFSKAMDSLGEGAREKAMAFLVAMIDENERDRVIELIGAKESNSLEPGEHLPRTHRENGEKA
jgi:hypothetical protein